MSGCALGLRNLLTKLLLLLLMTNPTVHAASFYGDGFVQLKSVESSSKNSLHVRFRTSSTDGLLFLAAGEMDFLWVALQGGRIQVQIELGSGERTLCSESAASLNDFLWHSIDLQHDHHNVTLTVDRTSRSSLRMPGPDLVLSVQDGLYVGGLENSDKLYLFNDISQVGFRGCLDEVLFNEHNLLSSLKPYSGYKMVREVSLGCSPQFLASVNDSISFFSSKAYVSLPMWEVPQEGVFECEFYTSAVDGLLLYNSAGKGNYVALEIQNKRLVAAVGVDGSRTALSSRTVISEERWHSVRLYVAPGALQLTVGEETLNSNFGAKFRAFQLNGPLFLGGVDTNTFSEVRRNGLLSVLSKHIGGGSFKGCLTNIRVNGQNMGLPNAVVTKDVSVGCEPMKHIRPIVTVNPDTLQPETIHLDNTKSQAFLLLKDLEVLEGGRAALEPEHIKILLDFTKLMIQQSQIMFRIEEQPVHGQLRLDVDPAQQENTFSILDLWHGRVMYVHGGSEDPQDFFMFSIFTTSTKEVPGYLKGNHLHRFNITIMAINDAPELILQEGNLFIVLENSKRHLTINMLQATDPDSKDTDLVFDLLGDLIASAGFLELDDNPGKPVNSFSYSDLEQGKVSFVHNGKNNSRIAIRVSDGEKVSNTVVLRIMAITLEYKIVNNTGVDVIQGRASYIGSEHLAVEVNVPKQAMDIRYDVIDPPTYGELQRLHSSGDWKRTSIFTQKLLEKDRLRYLSTFHGPQLKNVSDAFKCKISLGSTSTDEVHVHIRVRWVVYRVTRSKMVVKDGGKVTMTPEEFRIISRNVKLSESDIHVRLLTLPRKGNLLLNDQPLKKNSTFSQMNITDQKVQYELLKKSNKDLRDTFSFQVFSECSYSLRHDFRISIKANLHTIVLRNHGLSILEGETKIITKDNLFSETSDSGDVRYTISSSPQHGKLLRIHNSSSSSVVDFTNQDIIEQRILYVHDDSETIHDGFTFCASASSLNDIEGTFNISIQLVNDQKPVRVVDQVFHVAQNSQRLLTLEDLRYHDADSDYDDGQLLYTRREISMGELVLVNDSSHKLYQFHQRDLEEKRVLFVHRSGSVGRFVLFVSDGKHDTSTLLEVCAQDPYIKVANNTGLLIQKGQEVILQSVNFSVITNTDVRNDEDVLFEIFHPPSHGILFCEGIETDAFTQYDLKAGHVVYRHDDSRNLMDSLSLTATVNKLRLDITVAVKVYLESHQKPLQVIHNQSIVVEEGKTARIHKKELEVVHEDNTPDEILYILKMPPSHGFLRRSHTDEPIHHDSSVETFSQWDINVGHIQYVQKNPGHSVDSFTLDVTNRILTVCDLVVSVDIIPFVIPLEVLNITVKEGSAKVLTQNIIQVTGRHFTDVHVQYHVIEGPHCGRIEHVRIPGVPILSFTRVQVKHQFISYIHDGSETTTDNFTLVANGTDVRKQSMPHVIYVKVTAVNDEVPVITVNRILRVWMDSVTEITNDDLSVSDRDSAPESLEFIITPPSNGHLALKSAPSRPVLNFTQAHIHRRQLVFVHSGAMFGGFNFQVNDGVNFAPRQVFSIAARSLELSLETNRELKVFPGSSKVISQEDLFIATNDYDDVHENRTVIYSVTSPPRLGRLIRMRDDNSTDPISTFTQNMLNEGVVEYEHTEPVEWTATDSFIFTASSHPASFPPHTFNIHISYDNTSPEHRSVLLANTGAVVVEGSRIMIEKSMLDSSNLLGKLPEVERDSYEIWYRVTTLPHFGTIVVGERNLTRERPNFSQFILNKYGIMYVHDDSETTFDSFTFKVWLNPKGQPAQSPHEKDIMISESFNITILPVNDLPPLFKTQAPSLLVVKGDTVPLGPENLHVEDLDTLPEDILYTVISKPNNGFLALEGRLNESAIMFTQADVNEGRVHFVQEGHPTSGIFYFSVTDGFHRPLYKLFNLEVHNVTVSIVNNTGLTLVQGTTTGILTLQHLAAVTNKKDTIMKYYITIPPRHGRLMIEEKQITHFDHEALWLGKVSYQMTDLSSFRDSFEFTVATSESNLTNQVFSITVRPLIHLRKQVHIPDGIPVKIRKDVLDAAELASISRSDPIFEIIVPPKYGKLVKLTGNVGGASESVQSFTFTDVEQGRIAIQEHLHFGDTTALKNKTVYALKDSFSFLLKAANVQPAKGELVFMVVPYASKGKHVVSAAPVHPTLLPAFNKTGKNISHMSESSHTHPTKGPHLVLTKTKTRNRSGNHTRGKVALYNTPKTTSGRHNDPHRNTPIRVESLPRPASDPLLIILPFLACLFLIVILVGLILVFRHRQEKRAQPSMVQELPENSVEEIVSPGPYLGQPERSLTVPSVVVTPLMPRCSRSPVLEVEHNGALIPAIALPDSPMLLCPWTTMDPEATPPSSPGTPTLRQNQYWV